MMIKYRVREVAKDLNLTNKDVIDTLAKYFPEPKKYMTALEEKELDIVFETFTQERNLASLDEYFAQRELGPEPKREQEPEASGKKPAEPKPAPAKEGGKKQVQPKDKEAPKGRRGRNPSRSLPSRCASPRLPPAGWWIPAQAM